MSYPQAVATGNAVIAAAVAWVKALGDVDGQDTATIMRYGKATDALVRATTAHVAATAVEHQQTPKETGD